MGARRPHGRLHGRRFIAALAFIALSLVMPSATAETREPGFRIIVNPANPSGRDRISRTYLTQVFLRKVQSWSGGTVIHPVDLDRKSAVRRRFSEDGLGRSISAVRSYWQQMIFSGRNVPPPELPSDDAVVQFVLQDTGAIGYVAETTDLRGAKPLAIE